MAIASDYPGMPGADDDVAWVPSDRHRSDSNLAAFMDAYDYDDYDQLRPDSEREKSALWEAVADDLDLEWMTPYEEVLDTSPGVEFADWFTGGTLNLVETAVDRWAERTPDAAVYHWEDERGRAGGRDLRRTPRCRPCFREPSRCCPVLPRAAPCRPFSRCPRCAIAVSP